MIERKYTVREIDELRAVLEAKFLTGSYNSLVARSRDYRTEEKCAEIMAIEAMVRTHMEAGHTAETLLESQTLRDQA